MQTVMFYSLTAGLLMLSRLIGKRWYPGYLLGGLIFGLYNEICFEFCWDYSPALGPMLWRDVPLLVIAGWGVVTHLAHALATRVYAARQGGDVRVERLLDVAAFAIVGVPNEVIMSTLGYWEYNFPLQGTPLIQILGYLFVGILVSGVGFTLQSIITGHRAVDVAGEETTRELQPT